MSAAPLFEIEDLWVSAGGEEILRGVSLTIHAGELHALIGPGGSATSTLASTLLGDPAGEVTSGSIRFRGDDITTWGPDDRGRAGLFLAFRHPLAVPGVTVGDFLRQAYSARTDIDSSTDLRLSLAPWLERLGLDPSFVDRQVNHGFSIDEKARHEILQLAVLEPELAVLDETETGLDIDALRVIADGVRAMRKDRPDLGLLVVTDHRRFLDELQPSHVHLVVDGRVQTSGGVELAGELETDEARGVLVPS